LLEPQGFVDFGDPPTRDLEEAGARLALLAVGRWVRKAVGLPVALGERRDGEGADQRDAEEEHEDRSARRRPWALRTLHAGAPTWTNEQDVEKQADICARAPVRDRAAPDL
jgi:hypothetical protein